MDFYSQGELLRAEGIPHTFLVVSKNVYNETGQVIACPVRKEETFSPTNYVIPESGQTVICDQLRYLDLAARHVRRIGEVSVNDIVEISNIIESLFDYY